MRIEIITLHAVQNYGSILQALATQEIFKMHGCEVTIINYIREDVRPEKLLKTWGKGSLIKTLIMLPTVYRWKKVFTEFAQYYLNLSEKQYTTSEDFKSYTLSADAYCTGSDQVWNSKWNRGIIPSLYLDFIPAECYKFSFAASFGQDRISEKEVKETKKYIQQYKRISVRENGAKKIIKEQYDYPEAVHIIDPTICLPADFWRNYSSPRKVKEDYMLIYNLNRSKAFDNYAVELAKRTELKLVRICTRYDQFYRPGKSMLVPQVFDFISLIDNARYVLTDSFHATSFSMNMGTEPICVYPKEFGTRLESFLMQIDSLQRHVIDYNDFDVINRTVNFDKVKKILDAERKNANCYIDNVISDIRELNF